MSTLLSITRDELMPMIWSAQTPHVRLNIRIEERHNALVVVGNNDYAGLELGFAITLPTIINGYYREQMRDTLRHLVHLLENPASTEARLSTLPPTQDPGACRIH